MYMLSIERHDPVFRRFCPEAKLDLFARGFFQRQIFGQCVQREIAALRGFDIGLKRAADCAAEHEHLHDNEHCGCGCGHDHHEHDHDHGCCEHDHHEHDHDHECCGHDHHEHDHDHECCGHDHHEHDHDHECCGHDHHHHDHDHECGCGHHHHHADEVFNSIGFDTVKKYNEVELSDILNKLCNDDNVLRAKGFVDSGNEDWWYFDLVPGEFEIRLGKPIYTGQVCVIGKDLDENTIKELFLG